MQLSLLLRFGLVFAACCFSQPGALHAQQPKAANGTISGRVTLEGKPAQGVVVLALAEQSPQSRASAQARTDAEGRYQLTGLPAGQFKISVAAREYVSATADPRSLQPGLTVFLSDGEQLEGQELALVRGGVITGRVTNVAGQPLIEEALSLFRLDARGQKEHFSRTYMLNLKTDDRGVYRVYGLPAGRYLVAAGFDDQAPRMARHPRRLPLTYHPGVTVEAEAKPVEVTAGSETEGVDIRFGARERTSEVIVRVVDAESKQPVANLYANYARVQPDSRTTWPSGTRPQMTDSKGESRFEQVPPGRYRVTVQAVRPAESQYFAEPVPFEVVSEGTHRVEVTVRRGAVFSGTLGVENVSDPALRTQVKLLSLRLFRPFPLPGAPGSTPTPPAPQIPFNSNLSLAADLSFRSSGVPPGRYQLVVNNPYGFSIARIERNGQAVPNLFEVTGSESISGLSVVLGYSNASLRGQVQVAGGTLPPQARLMVSALNKNSTRRDLPAGQTVETDARGRFVMEFMHAGVYEVSVRVTFPPDFRYTNLPPALRRPQGMQEIVLGQTGEVQVNLTFDLNLPEGRL
jgi:hypothetical protein